MLVRHETSDGLVMISPTGQGLVKHMVGAPSDFVTLVMIALLERASETKGPSVPISDFVILTRIGLTGKGPLNLDLVGCLANIFCCSDVSLACEGLVSKGRTRCSIDITLLFVAYSLLDRASPTRAGWRYFGLPFVYDVRPY
jgi:hypothetical protein